MIGPNDRPAATGDGDHHVNIFGEAEEGNAPANVMLMMYAEFDSSRPRLAIDTIFLVPTRVSCDR